RRHPALAAGLGRPERGRDGEVGRQRQREAPPAARIVPDRFAGDETEQEVVLRPAEPAGPHVAADVPAITDVLSADEMDVVDIERPGYGGEVPMPPGLCPIGGEGEVGRD